MPSSAARTAYNQDACFGFAPVPGVSGAGPLTLSADNLDPLETSSRPQWPSDDDAVDPFAFRNPDAVPFEHRGWAHDRGRVYAAMLATDQPMARRCDFCNCGDRIHVFREAETNEIEVRPETCKDRFCLPCGQRRSRRIAIALEERMKPAADKLLFLTLTVRGLPSDSLAALLDKLGEAWKQLRRLDGWKNNAFGGAVMTEIKWSSKSDGHWHPHFHLIVEGNWIDPVWLSAAWFAITGDSHQVDVQRIKEPQQALSYVTKYASKPMDASFLRRPNLLQEAMRTLKGRRLCALFGSWYGTPLKEVDDGEETEVLTTWVYEGTTGDLDRRKQSGEAAAAAILGVVERVLRLRALRHRRCDRSSSHDPPVGDTSGQAA